MRMTRKLAVWFVLLALALVSAGCGAPPAPETLTLPTYAALSGYASLGSSYSKSFSSGSLLLGQTVTLIPLPPPPVGPGGHITVRTFNRVLLSFALPETLNGVEVTSAQIQLYLTSVTGTPLTSYGPVQIVHASFTASDTDEDVYLNCGLGSPTSAFSSATASAWTTIDVTDAVKNDLTNSRAYSQFRLQHQDETFGGDGQFTEWVRGTDTTANYARLVVVYTPSN